VITPFFGYDGVYTASDSLHPGHGYWLKSVASGLLVIDADATPSAVPGTSIGRADAAEPRDGTLSITDAAGRSATLILGGREAGTSRIELPPPPPAGAFDIRFDDGRRLVSTDDQPHPIRIRGQSYPLTLSWKVPQGDAYGLVTDEGTIRMEGSGGARLSDGTTLSVRRRPVDAGEHPVSFMLAQNYPNPFNPSTRITFSIPEGIEGVGKTSFVTLRIYDIGGRLVTVLLEKQMAAGEFDLNWNAGTLPGGVYIAVLRSGGASRYIKMLLLR